MSVGRGEGVGGRAGRGGSGRRGGGGGGCPGLGLRRRPSEGQPPVFKGPAGGGCDAPARAGWCGVTAIRSAATGVAAPPHLGWGGAPGSRIGKAPGDNTRGGRRRAGEGRAAASREAEGAGWQGGTPRCRRTHAGCMHRAQPTPTSPPPHTRTPHAAAFPLTARHTHRREDDRLQAQPPPPPHSLPHSAPLTVRHIHHREDDRLQARVEHV